MAILPMFGFAQNKYFNAIGINELAKTDCIIVVAPSSAIKSYGNCKISEDEFCKKCDYYLSDKDEFMGLRKIDFKIYD